MKVFRRPNYFVLFEYILKRKETQLGSARKITSIWDCVRVRWMSAESVSDGCHVTANANKRGNNLFNDSK